MNKFFPTSGNSTQFCCRTARTANIGASVRQIPTPSTFSCWKLRFKTQVSACSSSPSEAMSWIKEVEMVDSVDEFESSRSIQGYTHFPNFEMLDARFASALNLNKIIQNSHFKKRRSVWRNRKLRKRNRFLRGRHRFHDLRLLSSHWCSCMLIFLYHSSERGCSGIRYGMGRSFIIYVKDPIW